MNNKLSHKESFRLSDEEERKLYYICKRKNCSKSELFRVFIDDEYEETKKNKNVI